MYKIFVSSMSKAATAGLLMAVSGIAAAAPSALTPSTNDDFWVKLPAPVAIDWQQEGSCRYDYINY